MTSLRLRNLGRPPRCAGAIEFAVDARGSCRAAPWPSTGRGTGSWRSTAPSSRCGPPASSTRRHPCPIRTALEDMRGLLTQLAGAQPPDDRRDALARGYRAELDRPIVDGEVPSGLVLPSLGQAYVPPRFKVVQADQGEDVSPDDRWSEVPVRADLDDYLAGYFTSSQAVVAPLLVLGQPGAGKSLLTKMLAAQLPAGGLPADPGRAAGRAPADRRCRTRSRPPITHGHRRAAGLARPGPFGAARHPGGAARRLRRTAPGHRHEQVGLPGPGARVPAARGWTRDGR